MDRNYELKEIDVKNRTCYYFEDIMRVGDFVLNNVLLDKKILSKFFENILIYDNSCKNIAY